jgi:hypothetical protein
VNPTGSARLHCPALALTLTLAASPGASANSAVVLSARDEVWRARHECFVREAQGGTVNVLFL